MQGGSAGSVCCLALLLTIANAIMAENDIHSSDLKHTVFKRSSNDTDQNSTSTDNNEQVSTTELLSVVHDNEKTDEEVKRVDRSGEYPSSFKNLDAALQIAQAQQDLEARTSTPPIEPETESSTETSKPDSNTYTLVDTNVESDLLQSEAPNVITSTVLPDMENKQIRRGIGLYEPGYTRMVVPRSEMIYLDNVNGAAGLVSCSREGELYKLQTPWKECLVCSCMRELGRIQPVCVSCANCADASLVPPASYPLLPIPSTPPILPPTIEPRIIIPQMPIQQIPQQPQQFQHEIEIPGVSKICSPFPYGVPFDHPLNPCQICVCQRDFTRGNELYVTCKQDPKCAKPPEIPVLPPTPLPDLPIPTPLCEKFPKDIVFPHPTDACKICKCIEYPTSFGLTEKQIVCNPDPICGESLREIDGKPYPTITVSPLLPYPPQGKLPEELFPSGPSAPKQTYPQSPGWLTPQENLFQQLTITSPAPPPQMPSIISAPEGYPPSLSGILLPQEQMFSQEPIFSQEQNEPIIIAEATAYADGNETPIPSPAVLPPEVYPTRAPENVFTKPIESTRPFVPQGHLPWPPLTIPAHPKVERNRGPLLGPPPHQSCQPYPANTPFQHPWDECQLCLCAEFKTPGHVSIEVNCYTKAICCRLTDPASSLLGLEQQNIQSFVRNKSPNIQLLDPMCELKSFGVEFLSPKDPCKVCSCHQVGSLIVPSCRNADSPFCKTKTVTVPTGSITFIEPKCRNRAPEKPFVMDCNVCVCHTIFTYVISKCTPQPKCLDKGVGGDVIVDAQAIASANTQNGGGYSQAFANSGLYQSQNLGLPSGANNADTLTQLQGNNYQFGPYQQQQEMYASQAEAYAAREAANLLALMKQNSNSNVIKATASGQLGVNPGIDQNNVQQYQPQWSLPQTTTLAAPVSAKSFSSAQAFIDSINSPLQQNQNSYYGYPNSQQYQTAPEIIFEATSFVTPSNNYGNGMQQTYPYQNNLRGYPDSPQPNAFSTTPASLYSNTKSYQPNWSFKPGDASSWAPAQVSTANYLPSNNAWARAYSSSTVTPFAQKTTAPSSWDSTTMAYAQAEANARAQAQTVASNSGSVRKGRGKCQYAGDMYHLNCQACTCSADESTGELYSMCSGTPCH